MTGIRDEELLAAAKLALTEWDLHVNNIRLVSKAENTVFRLDTERGKPYALRIHRPGYHTLPELDSEQQWTAALDRAGIRVPIPQEDARWSRICCCRTFWNA